MVRHLIVTGPESSGKTTLSRKLASALQGVWIPEYARAYLLAAERPAAPFDFAHLAAATQHLLEAAAAQLARRPAGTAEAASVVQDTYIVQDTGYEVLDLWARDKFGGPVPAVTARLPPPCPGLYLLCRPDLPWCPDPLREDEGRRDELYRALRGTLLATGCPVADVSGFGESRLAAALRAVRALDGNIVLEGRD